MAKSITKMQIKLQDVCHLITDGKHGDCENQDNSGFYFLSCKDVRDGKLNYDNARQITKADFLDTHRRTRLEPRDILITNSGTIGRMAIAPNDKRTRQTTFQKSVAIVKPNHNKVNYKWLYYCLLAEVGRLISFAGGTAQKNLLLKDMRAFELDVPLPSHQHQTASILSTYDDLIENNTRRIAVLEEMVRRLYEEWFVQFRFPGHKPGIENGALPQGWAEVRLDAIAAVNPHTISPRRAPNEIKYIDISSVSPGRIDQVQPMAFADAPSRARRQVQSGDVLWSCVRPNRRSHALVLDPSPNTVASTGFAVLRAQKVPYAYLYAAVRTNSFVDYLVNHATGSAYPAVNQSDFEAATITLPSHDLLKKFEAVVEPLLHLAHRLDRKNANLRAQRDLLLPKLISGEIDVSKVREPEAAAA